MKILLVVLALSTLATGCGGDDPTDPTDGNMRGDTGTQMPVTNDATPGDPPPGLTADPPDCQIIGNFSALTLSQSKTTVSGTYQCYACSGVAQIPGGCFFNNRSGTRFICTWSSADNCS